MASYEVILTPFAIQRLEDLFDYIAKDLLVPETAVAYVKAIRDDLDSLSLLPGRIKPIASEPWHSKGVRRLLTQNYVAYYQIDDTAKKVFVIDVIYNRRDQLSALERKPE